ncbi:MAG TPA: TolC family protein [Gemmatimonadales bacterium]|nr:TolC family protein [Gemmatimonadales bacterium]
MRLPTALIAVMALGGAAPASAQRPVAPRPLTLEEALQLARPGSEAVGLARSAVQRARGQQLQARSELLPQLTGSASYSRLLKSQFSSLAKTDSTSPSSPTRCDKFLADPSLPIGARVDSLEKSLECVSSLNPFGNLGSLPFGRANTYNLGLSLSQSLFSGGRVTGQIQAANAGRQSAELGLTQSEAQLTLDVVQAYFDAGLGDQLSGIALTALEQADSTLRETELRRSLGTVPEFDLLRSRVTRDNQRAAAIQRAADRDLAYLRLKQLLDLPGDTPLQLTTSPDDSAMAGVPSLRALLATEGDTASEQRAPVRQAALAIRAEEGLLKVAKSQNLPSVALTSAYGRVAYPGSGLPSWNQFLTNWSVAVGLTVPLFTGGRISGDKVVARANLEDARLRYRQSSEFAQLDARSSQLQLASAREVVRASEGTEAQAVRAYDIAQIRYREGISTHTELLDARLALEQARANRAQAARDALVARMRMALISRLPLSGAVTQSPSSSAVTRRASQQTQTSATSGFGIP